MEQEKIWAHFQDPAHNGFADAVPRYVALAADVRRRARGQRVLNVGIGGGGVERALLAEGWRVSSLDPDPAAVAHMLEIGIDAKVGYVQEMPFEAGSFDAVVISEVLEHVGDADRARAIAELHRVLKPDGLLFGTVPYAERLQDQTTVCPNCGEVFHRWGHVASFDRSRMNAELTGLFSVLRSGPRSFVSWNGPLTVRRILKNVMKLMLGRLGEAIVSPVLYFVARRSDPVK